MRLQKKDKISVNKTILIIEDSLELIEVYKIILSSVENLCVDFVTSFKDFKSNDFNKVYDLVISDWKLSDTENASVIIKEVSYKNLIIATAYKADPDLVKFSSEINISGYLDMPNSYNFIKDSVINIIKGLK